MFVSGFALKNAVEKYRKSKRRERYSANIASKSGSSSVVTGVVVTLAIIFFIMELVVLYYAVAIAFSCTKKGPERVVNIALAILFPFPYVMLNILFNECAKSTLQASSFNL